jgi:hypothetical protein
MNIEEFVEAIALKLANFQEDWYCKSLIDNINFSVDTEMDLAEWLEQLEIYIDEVD